MMMLVMIMITPGVAESSPMKPAMHGFLHFPKYSPTVLAHRYHQLLMARQRAGSRSSQPLQHTAFVLIHGTTDTVCELASSYNDRCHTDTNTMSLGGVQTVPASSSLKFAQALRSCGSGIGAVQVIELPGCDHMALVLPTWPFGGLHTAWYHACTRLVNQTMMRYRHQPCSRGAPHNGAGMTAHDVPPSETGQIVTRGSAVSPGQVDNRLDFSDQLHRLRRLYEYLHKRAELFVSHS